MSRNKDSNSLPPVAVVLAAGRSTRFKSDLPKVLHPLCGVSIIGHVLQTLGTLDLERTLVVVGHGADRVRTALAGVQVEFVLQSEQLGTGHAVQCAAPLLADHEGSVLILNGDSPLIRPSTLQGLIQMRRQEEADLTLITTRMEEPFGYGRIIRDQAGEAIAIVEEKEATPEQAAILEVNPGFYCFRSRSLRKALEKLEPSRKAGEYYLTDLLHLIRKGGGKIATLPVEDAGQTLSVNTREQLARAEALLRERINRRWMLEGVTLHDPRSVYIDASVTLEADTRVYPGVFLEGETRIGSGCIIHSHCHLANAVLEEGVVVDHSSVIRDSRVGANSRVGPFAHLRQDCEVGARARIGNFVEVKKSRIGEGTKSAHLAYLGDARVGKNVNIGAGAITCNFDGRDKHETVIEDEAFVGSDAQLVAPVRVGRGAYVASGSTVTDDVPEDALAIARGRQVNKEGWAKRRREEGSRTRGDSERDRSSSKQSRRGE